MCFPTALLPGMWEERAQIWNWKLALFQKSEADRDSIRIETKKRWNEFQKLKINLDKPPMKVFDLWKSENSTKYRT